MRSGTATDRAIDKLEGEIAGLKELIASAAKAGSEQGPPAMLAILATANDAPEPEPALPPKAQAPAVRRGARHTGRRPGA